MTDLSSALPNKTFQSVNSWLNRVLPTGQGWDLDLIVTKGKAERARHILRARDGSGRQIGLKTHSLRFRNFKEFQALRSLNRAQSDSIAAVHLSRDLRFYAMDWGDRPLVRDLLGSARRTRILEMSGEWLASLHAAPRQRWIPNNIRPPVDLKARSGDDVIDQATYVIRKRLRAVLFRPAPFGVLHGDLHTGNLFDYGSRLKAFDREYNSYGLTFIDVGRFLADLTLRRAESAAAGDPWDGSGEEDRRAFFEAYGPVAERDLAHFDAIEDAFIFRMWRRHMRRDGSSILTEEMRSRGVLPGPATAPRPARLVESADNRILWTPEELV